MAGEARGPGFVDEAHCDAVRDFLATFANAVRLRLLCHLVRGEATVQELARWTGRRQPLVSQHLRVLRLAGMVAREQRDGKVYYRIKDPRVAELLGFLTSLVEPPSGD